MNLINEIILDCTELDSSLCKDNHSLNVVHVLNLMKINCRVFKVKWLFKVEKIFRRLKSTYNNKTKGLKILLNHNVVRCCKVKSNPIKYIYPVKMNITIKCFYSSYNLQHLQLTTRFRLFISYYIVGSLLAH